jgi:hypothetical protein
LTRKKRLGLLQLCSRVSSSSNVSKIVQPTKIVERSSRAKEGYYKQKKKTSDQVVIDDHANAMQMMPSLPHYPHPPRTVVA